MGFELDHVFVCTAPGAPEADRLIELGFAEGARNQHPGQGTANRRFFFNNSMIELLFLTNEREAKSDLVAPLRLYERCRYRETGASPFGVCLRPDGESEAGLPFECWEYRPPYLPEGMSINVAVDSSLIHEPLLFYTRLRTGRSTAAAQRGQTVNHAIGVSKITAVDITTTALEPPSSALSALVDIGSFSLRSGSDHLIEIEFDRGRQGRLIELGPALPVVLKW
jgi:hypothetical protein